MAGSVLIVGIDRPEALENSYARAFAQLGWHVTFWDLAPALRRTVRGGKWGYFFSQFVRVEPWLRKANRELVLCALDLQPDLVLTFTHPQIMPGALAQITTSTSAKLAQIWPDPLLSWEANLSANLPIYDLIATFSQATVSAFLRMGARKAIWLPFAGDPELLFYPSRSDIERGALAADVTFIGAWRAEREAVLSQLGAFDLKIWGPDWGRRCRHNRTIMNTWQGRSLRGAEFAKAVASSKINLNIIDATIPSAANMRFFEIPTAGGLQVCSPCPEMEAEFRHGEHLFYYRQPDDLLALLHELLADDALRAKVAAAAHSKVLAEHTYTHRARRLLEALDLHL